MMTNPFYAYTQTPIEPITSDPAVGGDWYESNADLRAAVHPGQIDQHLNELLDTSA